MRLRLMTTAFLFNDGKVLMMKKSNSSLHHETFWSGLGGHMEPDELNDPKRACIREIYEESGLEEADLADLRLRYILLRRKEHEIRQQFVYMGRTLRTDAVSSEEGELFWIERDGLPALRLSRIIRFMLEHSAKHPHQEQVAVGTISMDDGREPRIHWAELRDPIVF
ncbi:NUDIX domain-containing protein [Paenibacillus piri]|uniref:NUDIX domain-containing protein n=1 Tax=Paenibacillus piri TaxID=2547395 RepID=A0A4R5KW11_9BACL|nr:NUDIX domain-containing protein [Paenibacillus piri]TDF99187.1 NUDIX domain-containing protein [Paenibacillus piri]